MDEQIHWSDEVATGERWILTGEEIFQLPANRIGEERLSVNVCFLIARPYFHSSYLLAIPVFLS